MDFLRLPDVADGGIDPPGQRVEGQAVDGRDSRCLVVGVQERVDLLSGGRVVRGWDRARHEASGAGLMRRNDRDHPWQTSLRVNVPLRPPHPCLPSAMSPPDQQLMGQPMILSVQAPMMNPV